MSFDINIISTGSKGNCIVIDEGIMIDFGLKQGLIKDDVLNMDVILCTHCHGDHMNVPMLNTLYKENKPLFMSALYMNQESWDRAFSKSKLLSQELGYNPTNVITGNSELVVKSKGRWYTIKTFSLVHDVENQGFIIENEEGETLLYATDTNSMAQAPNILYDYIILEGNYDEDKIREAMMSEDEDIRRRAFRNLRHFSIQQYEDFVLKHSHPATITIQLHESKDFGSKSILPQG